MTRNKLWLIVEITGLLLAAAIFVSAVSRPEVGAAAEENSRFIEVEGEATMDVKPDTVTLNIGCRTQLPTAREAQEENAKKMNAVIQKLLEMGFARNDIATTSLTLSPVYDYSQNTPRLTGYAAENIVKASTTHLDKVGEIVDAAVAAGANNISGIYFSVKDMESYRQQLLAKAAEVARARAEVLAKASGTSVKGVRCIVQSELNSPPTPIYYAKVADRAASASTPIMEGQLTLKSTVRMQFDI
ncbi:MAG TPA: SIMPL domain-containing protein [Firmicutes bacterium]|nr:SIMPL domain-containing protein [Bacillota bacterium]